ncbi:hypothetical protein C8R46DRAFT_1218925 [Mycena filopes]|nr:hypothetical protein C8R46DRAFT_1218925 [Mycena filopes]
MNSNQGSSSPTSSPRTSAAPIPANLLIEISMAVKPRAEVPDGSNRSPKYDHRKIETVGDDTGSTTRCSACGPREYNISPPPPLAFDQFDTPTLTELEMFSLQHPAELTSFLERSTFNLNLTKLVLRSCNAGDGELLAMLAHMPQLENLVILDGAPNLVTNCLLQHLTINRGPSTTNNIPRLASLILSGNFMFTDVALGAMLKSRTQSAVAGTPCVCLRKVVLSLPPRLISATMGDWIEDLDGINVVLEIMAWPADQWSLSGHWF